MWKHHVIDFFGVLSAQNLPTTRIRFEAKLLLRHRRCWDDSRLGLHCRQSKVYLRTSSNPCNDNIVENFTFPAHRCFWTNGWITKIDFTHAYNSRHTKPPPFKFSTVFSSLLEKQLQKSKIEWINEHLWKIKTWCLTLVPNALRTLEYKLWRMNIYSAHQCAASIRTRVMSLKPGHVENEINEKMKNINLWYTYHAYNMICDVYAIYYWQFVFWLDLIRNRIIYRVKYLIRCPYNVLNNIWF